MPILEVRGLTKFIAAQKVIDNLTFTIEKGEVLGFLGTNDAGKTTTVRLITGLYRADGGEILIAGLDARRQPLRVIGEEMPLPGHDIIYPLNYIYASGYYPSFQVWADEWDEELPVEEAAAGLQDFFRVYTEFTPEVKKTIADYVEKRAVKGIFSEKYRVRLGMILWTVGKKWEAETGAV